MLVFRAILSQNKVINLILIPSALISTFFNSLLETKNNPEGPVQ